MNGYRFEPVSEFTSVPLPTTRGSGRPLLVKVTYWPVVAVAVFPRTKLPVGVAAGA